MNLKNPKVFKFIRREYQASEQINPKKTEENKSKSLPKQEQKLRQYINYFAQEEKPAVQMKKQEIKSQKQPQVHHKNLEAKVSFDKKMTRVVMPDHLQKIKFIKRIENKLISCLQKRKPHVPVKNLISEEMLVEVICKNERKLITKTNVHEKLNLEAQSIKKNINTQSTTKIRLDVEEIQLQAEKKAAMNQQISNFIPLGSANQEAQISFQGLDDQNLRHESNFQHFNYFSSNLFDHQSCFAKFQQKDARKDQNRANPKALPKKNYKYTAMEEIFSRNQSQHSENDRRKMENFSFEGEINLKNLKIPRLNQHDRRDEHRYRHNIQTIQQEEFSFVKERPTNGEQPLSIFKAVHKEQQRNKFRNL